MPKTRKRAGLAPGANPEFSTRKNCHHDIRNFQPPPDMPQWGSRDVERRLIDLSGPHVFMVAYRAKRTGEHRECLVVNESAIERVRLALAAERVVQS